MKDDKKPKRPLSAKQFRPSAKRLLVLAIVGLATVALLFQIALDVAFYNRVVSGGDPIAMISLVTRAVDGLSKSANTDSKTGEVYLTEARLALPASPAPYDQLLYGYYTLDNNNSPTELHVTTRQAVQAAEADLWSTQASKPGWRSSNMSATFDVVSSLQACSRGVTVYIGAKDISVSHISKENTVQLKDGRIMQLGLANSDSRCPTDMNGLINYLRRAQSY